HGHEARLRPRHLWLLHGAPRRTTDPELPHARPARGGTRGDDHRGSHAPERALSRAACVRAVRRHPMRLLHPGFCGDRHCPPPGVPPSEPRGDRAGHLGQPVPVHRISEDRRGHRSGGPGGAVVVATPPPSYRLLGGRIPYIEGPLKVTGRAEYTDDIRRPGILVGRLLRSPWPHARLRSIDTSAARALPGVHAVLTGDRYPIPFGVLPITHDETAIAVDKARYIGDIIAAVAATDELTAERALSLIRVDIEPLPEYADPRVGTSKVAEPIHSRGLLGSNIQKEVVQHFGNVDAAFAHAATSPGSLTPSPSRWRRSPRRLPTDDSPSGARRRSRTTSIGRSRRCSRSRCIGSGSSNRRSEAGSEGSPTPSRTRSSAPRSRSRRVDR